MYVFNVCERHLGMRCRYVKRFNCITLPSKTALMIYFQVRLAGSGQGGTVLCSVQGACVALRPWLAY